MPSPDRSAPTGWKLPDEYEMLRDTVRRFMQEEVRPVEDTLPHDATEPAPADLARAWRSATPDDYPMMVAATPLTALALGAYTVGCITAHPTPLRRRA